LEYLRGMSTLQHLDLTKTKVTAEGVKKLSAALPRCKILYDGGVIGPIATELAALDPALFSGSKLNGWSSEGKVWRIENGELMCTSPGARLSSQRTVRDFRLQFDAKRDGDAFLVVRSTKAKFGAIVGFHGGVHDEGWKDIGFVNGKKGVGAYKNGEYNRTE